jgi:hypothetical protein
VAPSVAPTWQPGRCPREGAKGQHTRRTYRLASEWLATLRLISTRHARISSTSTLRTAWSVDTRSGEASFRCSLPGAHHEGRARARAPRAGDGDQARASRRAQGRSPSGVRDIGHCYRRPDFDSMGQTRGRGARGGQRERRKERAGHDGACPGQARVLAAAGSRTAPVRVRDRSRHATDASAVSPVRRVHGVDRSEGFYPEQALVRYVAMPAVGR